VLDTDGRVDISRSRIRNLIAASRPQFEFHEILSTKPIRSYSAARTTFAPHVPVSKRHTHTHTQTHVRIRIDPGKVSDTLTGRIARSTKGKETRRNQKPSGAIRTSAETARHRAKSRIFYTTFSSARARARGCSSILFSFPRKRRT
jgi:hypothetical protein